MVAAVAAQRGPDAPAGLPTECFESLWSGGRPEPTKRTLGPLSVGVGLLADSLKLGNAVLQHGVGEIGNAVLERVVEALELGVRFGRALAQCSDMQGLALGALLAAVEHGGQDFLETRRLHGGLADAIVLKRSRGAGPPLEVSSGRR